MEQLFLIIKKYSLTITKYLSFMLNATSTACPDDDYLVVGTYSIQIQIFGSGSVLVMIVYNQQSLQIILMRLLVLYNNTQVFVQTIIVFSFVNYK